MRNLQIAVVTNDPNEIPKIAKKIAAAVNNVEESTGSLTQTDLIISCVPETNPINEKKESVNAVGFQIPDRPEITD